MSWSTARWLRRRPVRITLASMQRSRCWRSGEERTIFAHHQIERLDAATYARAAAGAGIGACRITPSSGSQGSSQAARSIARAVSA